MTFKHYSLFSFFLLLTAVALPTHADYVAYSVLENKSTPLPQDIDGIEAKYLVNVKWGQYKGNKSRVGVMGVQNNSSVSTLEINSPRGRTEISSGTGGVPVQGIEAIMTDVMHRTKRFRIVERAVLDKVLKEEDLGATGRVSKPSAAKIGKVLGAQYIVQAVVTHYEPDFEGRDIGLGGITGGVLGGLSISSKKSMVGMNFRLINAETSEVEFTKQVESVMSDSGLAFGGLGGSSKGGLGGFMSSYSKTLIGQAVIAAVNKGVYELVKQVGTAPVRGSVVKVKGGSLYLNLGKGRVQVGEQLKVVTLGESLIDPETGLNLGGEETEVGKVTVTAVKDKYSLARPLGALAGKVKKGDRVVSTRPPAGLQFASAWTEESSGSSSSGGGGSSDDDDDF